MGYVIILYLLFCLADFECYYFEDSLRDEKGCSPLLKIDDFFDRIISLEYIVIGEGDGVLPFSLLTLFRLIIIQYSIIKLIKCGY